MDNKKLIVKQNHRMIEVKITADDFMDLNLGLRTSNSKKEEL